MGSLLCRQTIDLLICPPAAPESDLMIRVTTTILLCLAALAGWSGSASAADLPFGLLDQPSVGQDAGAEEESPASEEEPSEETAEEDEAEAEESESAETSSEEEPFVVETTAAFTGAARLRGLKKLTYVAACPDVDCQLSLDVELRFPGGRKLMLDAPIKNVAAGKLKKLSVKLPRAARKSLRRARARNRNVVAVAYVVEWSSDHPEYGKAIRTRLR